MKKKIISLFMVAAMTASLVGCGGGSDSSSTTDSTATDNTAATTDTSSAADTTAADNTEAAPADDIEKPSEITIMIDGTVPTKENGQAEFFAKFEELTGIKINVIQPDHDAYYDNVGQVIASGDWPDVIILSSTYYSAYAAEGVLWDMTDAWENSDLKARQEAHNSVSVVEGVKLNGRLYGMPDARGGGCVTYVKKAWMDNCGITSVPTTYDEYLAMLEAFTTGDPDGDGVDGNTFGVTAAGFIGSEAPYINYLPEFYQDAHPSFYQKADGTWADGFTEDAMKGALERLADAYAKGVIDPTTLTNGTADCRNKFYSDDFGVFTYWAGTWATNLKNNLINNDIDSELIPMEPIAEVPAYLDRIPPVWCITSTCENPEGVFKYFIETMQDGSDVQFLWTYGVEGVHWSTAAETLYEGQVSDSGESKEKVYAEGEFHMLDNLETPGTQYTKAHIDPNSALVELANDPLEQTVAAETKASNELFAVNCVTADLVPSTDAMTEYNGDLQSLKNEIVAKVAMGEMTVEEGYAKFEADGGAAWSQQIVDSLNQ